MTNKPIEHHFTKTLATPESRAKRIRYVREHLLNLSRSELCKNSDLIEASLKSWELAMAGGLTEKGAEKLSKLFKSFNIHCTASWLLHEIGAGPVKNPEKIIFSDEEERQIADELLIFRRQPQAIDTVVRDDAMVPLLKPGDFVAGIAVKKIDHAINKECIIITANDNIYVRLLKQDIKRGKYFLDYLNPHSVIAPELKNVEIKLAAPIIWIRKKLTR